MTSAPLSAVAVLPAWMAAPVMVEGVAAADLECTVAEDAHHILSWHGKPVTMRSAVPLVMSGIGGFYLYAESTARAGLRAAADSGMVRTFRFRGVWMVEPC